MVLGALVATTVATMALESWATARAPVSSYEPPALVASPASVNKKTDGTLSGVQRARPRVITASLDQRV